MYKKLGFTMIELLVVIAVIGILAVALLSTLNPLEQIRKGRDTRTRADMSQMLSATERYNASLGYFPWQTLEGQDVNVGVPDIGFYKIGGSTGSDDIVGSSPLETLAEALARLTETSEVKSSFIDRISGLSYPTTYMFYDDEVTGSSVIACFTPESQSFQKEAFDRCKAGVTAWSSDFIGEVYGSADRPCPDGDATAYAAASFDPTSTDEMVCLP